MGRFDNKFEWSIANEELFQERLKNLGDATSDFRIPFRLISSDFYRSQKQLFSLKSQGMYEDLSEKPFTAWWPNKRGIGAFFQYGYKEYKQSELGFIYPILVGKTRDLSESTLSNRHRYSIYSLGRQELQIGSSVPYGKYHQSDKARRKIPQRKFVFIDGGEGDTSRGSGINGRSERWTMIINTHLNQLITGRVA
jgi:hypothetical protein